MSQCRNVFYCTVNILKGKIERTPANTNWLLRKTNDRVVGRAVIANAWTDTHFEEKYNVFNGGLDTAAYVLVYLFEFLKYISRNESTWLAWFLTKK